MARTSQKQKLFNGRDHSWMQFNRRVLEEAEDPANPLLERVKFLAITGSNLDEYVEVRQAGLMQRIEDGYREPGYDGLRPEESLAGSHCRYSQLCGRAVPLLERAPAARAAQARHSPAGVGRAQPGRPRLCPQLLSARGRSAADAHHHRPRPSFSARAEQSSLPGAAASRQAPQLRPAGAGRGDGAARAAALCAAARRRWPVRLPAAAGPDRAASGRHVSRLRGAGFSLVPRDPQLQPLLRGGRSAVAA